MEERKLKKILGSITETPFVIREKADYFLSEEFVEKMAIENGIPIPSHYIAFQPQLEIVEAKKEVVYTVGGFTFCLKNKQAALDLQELLVKLLPSIVKLDYDYYHGNIDFRYIESVDDGDFGNVGTKSGYSQHEYNSIAGKLKRNKELTEAFEKAKKHHESKHEDYTDLNNGIREFVSLQIETASRWASLKEKYNRYIEVLPTEEALNAFKAVEKPEVSFMEWLLANKDISVG